MAKRHRRRTKSDKQQPTQERITAKGSLMLVPTSPAVSRVGLDSDVIMALQDLDRLVGEMRKSIPVPNGVWDESSAVQRYLVYLSMLVDVVFGELVMSALHSNDWMVHMKQRMLIEYAAKGAYYDDHPQYALFMMTIGKAEDRLRKVTDAGSDPGIIEAAEQHRDDMRQQFPAVVHTKRVTFAEIMTTYGGRDDYVWLYGAPSALMHGDPEGIDHLIEILPDGTQQPHLTLPLERVNAMLVDAGTNTLMFCNHFIGTFHPEKQPLIDRYKTLHRRFLELVLKHPYGRDADGLRAVTDELVAG